MKRNFSLFLSSLGGNPDPKFLSVSVALPCSSWLGLPLYKVRLEFADKIKMNESKFRIRLIPNARHPSHLIHVNKFMYFLPV